MIATHRVLRAWTDPVSVFIALSNFARSKFVEGGVPAEKIVVKPNFVSHDPGAGDGNGGYFLFAGRLSPEKGVSVLLRAWPLVNGIGRLKIVGAGPLSDEVSKCAAVLKDVEFMGWQAAGDVLTLFKGATALVIPSIHYEGFPMVIAEAFATGLPVIASGIGSLLELVEDGRTGVHFRAGDAEDLARKIEWVATHPDPVRKMRREARAEYEAKYNAQRNYRMLMDIYDRALANQ